MRISDFDFDLPPALIAERPASPRDAARLMVWRPESGIDPTPRAVRDLPALLRPNDILVTNDTRVIPARLFGRRMRGDSTVEVEALLLKSLGQRRWSAMARPMRRLKPGDRIDFAGGIAASVAGRADENLLLDFDRDDAALLSALDRAGAMPLPPYIAAKRAADARDRSDYQTVFARDPGSVAAPTAGLHFTPDLLARLEEVGIARSQVTLHVGAGTFLPVKAERIEDHRMHAEWGEVTSETVAAIAEARAKGGRVIAVGTTSLRLLETAARATGMLAPFRGETDIFIAPGFRFQVADALLTNFHLPRSTLLMLVAAFVGLEAQRAIYARAIADRYRFYSYGDASLLFRAP